MTKEDTLTGQQEIEKEGDKYDNDEDLSFDEADGKQTTTGSTSQWVQSDKCISFSQSFNHTIQSYDSLLRYQTVTPVFRNPISIL